MILICEEICQVFIKPRFILKIFVVALQCLIKMHVIFKV